jgi:hypothetical protein
LSHLYIKRSFCQDRLGTNIGKRLKKRCRFSHLRKTPLLSKRFLCLSRACRGKLIPFSVDYIQISAQERKPFSAAPGSRRGSLPRSIHARPLPSPPRDSGCRPQRRLRARLQCSAARNRAASHRSRNMRPARPAETRRFVEFSLCLSRARLGKTVVFA